MNDVQKRNRKVYVHAIIMFVLGFIVSILPPFGQITPMGMDVLAVFVMLVYGWIFVDLFWISLLGFFLLALTQVTTVQAAFITAFSNQTVIMTLLIFSLAAGLNALGIGDAIANYVLSRKFIVGKPWVLIVTIITLAFLLSLIGKGMVGCILLWAIVGNILKTCGYEDQSSLLSFLFCMIFFAAMIPTYVDPYQPMILMFSTFYKIGTEIVHPFGAYFILGIILYAVTFIIMIFLAKFVFRIDASKFNITEEMCNAFAAKKTSKVTKVAMIALLCYIAILIIPEFLPSDIPIVAAVKSVGLLGWTVVYLAIFSLWRDKETGVPALKLEDCFSKIQWTTVMLMGVTLPVGNALGSAEVGVMATVTQIVKPMTEGLGVFGFYVFCFVLLGVLTQVLHNMVLGVMFMPLFGTIGVAMGCNPYILFFLMFIALNTAYATPAGCGSCGLLYGNNQIKRTHTYMWGTILIVVTLIVGILMFPLYNMML